MRMFVILMLAIFGSAQIASPIRAAVPVQALEASQRASDLARLLHPLDLALATAIEGSDRFFVPAMLKQPEMAELEAEHPGLIQAMYAAGRPFMIEVERRNALRVQEELAALYQTAFSADEMRKVREFFSSPTGQKMIGGMFHSEGLSSTFEAVAADPEADISTETMLATQAQAIGHMVSIMTADDEKAAAAFLVTSAGTKFKALAPKVQAIAVEIVNIEHPDLQAHIEAAMAGSWRVTSVPIHRNDVLMSLRV